MDAHFLSFMIIKDYKFLIKHDHSIFVQYWCIRNSTTLTWIVLFCIMRNLSWSNLIDLMESDEIGWNTVFSQDIFPPSHQKIKIRTNSINNPSFKVHQIIHPRCNLLRHGAFLCPSHPLSFHPLREHIARGQGRTRFMDLVRSVTLHPNAVKPNRIIRFVFA